jgi:hypothetical protein
MIDLHYVKKMWRFLKSMPADVFYIRKKQKIR